MILGEWEYFGTYRYSSHIVYIIRTVRARRTRTNKQQVAKIIFPATKLYWAYSSRARALTLTIPGGTTRTLI